MTEYRVGPDEYRQLVDAVAPEHESWAADYIGGLCAKFAIVNQQVLSIGPGWAFEEYQFVRNSNSVCLVDTFHGAPEYQSAWARASTESGDTTYLVGDCRSLPPAWLGRFSVIYISGLTILELLPWEQYPRAVEALARYLKDFMTSDGILLLKTYSGGHQGQSAAPLEAAGFTVFDVTFYITYPGVELTSAFASYPAPERLGRIHAHLAAHGEHNLGRRHQIPGYEVGCHFRVPPSAPTSPPA